MQVKHWLVLQYDMAHGYVMDLTANQEVMFTCNDDHSAIQRQLQCLTKVTADDSCL